MHPFFKNKAQLLIYLALWIPLEAVFVLLLLNQQPPWPLRAAIGFTALAGSAFAFLFLSMYFVCRALPLRESSLGKIVLWHATTVSVASFLWLFSVFVLTAAMDRLTGGVIYTNTLRDNFIALVMLAYVVMSLAEAVGYLLLALEDQQTAEKQREQMQTLAKEAELRSLRSQINPHFLFNSLNSISALTTLNPERAREMCLLLSDFFRRNIDIGNQETTTLGEELDLVFNYLQIEMARFSKRLQIHTDVPDDLRAFTMPPLLLQPLAENAVKHGIAGMVEGGTISIRARALTIGGISITVENPFDPEQPPRKRQGIGIQNVRGRLEYRYGRDARFDVSREANRFRAKIQIAVPDAARAGGTTAVPDSEVFPA